ncbi:hypothetical protein ACU4GD_20860 [Cupriavidus basilensis]
MCRSTSSRRERERRDQRARAAGALRPDDRHYPGGPTQLISSNIYEGLLRYDEKLEPLPALATSWTVSPAGTVYIPAQAQGHVAL